MPQTPSSSPDLTCRELVELVTDYFENALPATERARLESHLASCDGCDRYIQQMRQTIQALGALKQEDVSPEAQEKLNEVFREWRGELDDGRKTKDEGQTTKDEGRFR